MEYFFQGFISALVPAGVLGIVILLKGAFVSGLDFSDDRE